MDEWVAAVAKELGVEGDADVATLLEIARVAAHNVERPAAPVTTFLAGLAVGKGADLAGVSRQISALAEGWQIDPE